MSEDRNYYGFSISCQVGSTENLCGGDAPFRAQYQVAAIGQLNLGEDIADALRKGWATEDKHRHVGTQGPRELHQRFAIKAGIPEPIQGDERTGGVTRPPTQPGTGRNVLGVADLRTQWAPCSLLKSSCRPYDEISLGCEARQGIAFSPDLPIVSNVEIKPIT